MLDFLCRDEGKNPPSLEEWIAARKAYIGASDVPAIMGTCDFKSAMYILADKCDLLLPVEQNFAMKRGHELEPIAREMYERIYECLAPAKNFRWDILSVNLDGFVDSARRVVEIKAPSAEKHQMALLGEIPSCYVDQVQTQLMVSRSRVAHYVSYSPTENDRFKLAVVETYTDQSRQEKILETCREFWKNVIQLREILADQREEHRNPWLEAIAKKEPQSAPPSP